MPASGSGNNMSDNDQSPCAQAAGAVADGSDKYLEKAKELLTALNQDVANYNENFKEPQKLDSSGVKLKTLSGDDSIECKLFSCYHAGCASNVTAVMKSCINLLQNVDEESAAKDAPERKFAALFMRLYRVIILYKADKQNDSQGNKSTGSTVLSDLQSKITNDSDKSKGEFKRILTQRTRFSSLENDNTRASQASIDMHSSNNSGVFENDLFLAKYFLNSNGRFNVTYKTLVIDQPDVNAGFSKQEFGVTVIPQVDCSDIILSDEL